MGGKRGRLIKEENRSEAIKFIREAQAHGARKYKACELLGLSVRTLERWEKPSGCEDKRKTAIRSRRPNELTNEERAKVLKVANSEEYRDLSPNKIVPLLADKGIYLASESTFYRLLREEAQLAHRQRSKPKKHSRPKSFLAKQSNQVWSWDISYLPTRVKGLYFYLYVVTDIYSRKIVGWSIHDEESSEWGSKLVKQACLDEGVKRDELVLHSDNGKPMKGMTMLAMLEHLGVMPSFSRPSVSDDNPYSESLFKTIKYHWTFPYVSCFGTLEEARTWMESFNDWYNNKHLHSGIKFVTPSQRHRGEDIDLLQNRHVVYQKAKLKHPLRWSNNTRNWDLVGAVSLNPSKDSRNSGSLATELAAA